MSLSNFSISRQAASKTFKRYISLYPQAIIYDDTVKGFVPDSAFSYHHSNQNFIEYQRLTNNNTQHSPYESLTNIIEVQGPTRDPNPQLAQPILRAIAEKTAIDIGYTSLATPEYKDRIIEPHSLIFDGLRWHVRAYCRKNQGFRDFVLSRFNGEVIDEGKATNDITLDQQWNHIIDIEIMPDPRLSSIQQQVIARDYQMEQGKCIMPTRAPLINYFLKRLNLDHYAADPLAQQIVLSEHTRQQIASYIY